MFSKVYLALTSLIAGVKISEMFNKKGVDSTLVRAINKLQSTKSK